MFIYVWRAAGEINNLYPVLLFLMVYVKYILCFSIIVNALWECTLQNMQSTKCVTYPFKNCWHVNYCDATVAAWYACVHETYCWVRAHRNRLHRGGLLDMILGRRLDKLLLCHTCSAVVFKLCRIAATVFAPPYVRKYRGLRPDWLGCSVNAVTHNLETSIYHNWIPTKETNNRKDDTWGLATVQLKQLPTNYTEKANMTWFFFSVVLPAEKALRKPSDSILQQKVKLML